MFYLAGYFAIGSIIYLACLCVDPKRPFHNPLYLVIALLVWPMILVSACFESAEED